MVAITRDWRASQVTWAAVTLILAVVGWFASNNAQVEAVVGELAWQVPFGAFALLAVGWAVLAPYWIYRETHEARLEAEAEAESLRESRRPLLKGGIDAIAPTKPPGDSRLYVMVPMHLKNWGRATAIVRWGGYLEAPDGTRHPLSYAIPAEDEMSGSLPDGSSYSVPRAEMLPIKAEDPIPDGGYCAGMFTAIVEGMTELEELADLHGWTVVVMCQDTFEQDWTFSLTLDERWGPPRYIPGIDDCWSPPA